LLAAAASLVVGFPAIANPSLWYDEAVSITVASRTLPQIIELLHSIDLVHGLYYLVLHFWGGLFGWGELPIRLLSLLALAGAAAGFAVLARKWLDRAAARWGIAVFVLIPGLVWSGGEARGYALALAATIWATVLLDSALARGGVGRWCGYVLVMLVAVGFLLHSLLSLGFHAFLAWRAWRAGSRPGQRLGLIASAGALVICALPFAFLAWQQRDQVSWASERTPVELLGKAVLGQVFVGPRDAADAALPLALGAAGLSLLVSLLLIVWWLPSARRSSSIRFALGLGVTWWVLPTVLVLAQALVMPVKFYEERWLTQCNPGICLLLGPALAHAWDERARAMSLALTIALAAGFATNVAIQRTEDSKHGDGYRALARFGQDAATVIHMLPSGRSVAITYPTILTAQDWLLDQDGFTTATFWGTNLAPDEAPAPPPGKVVGFFYTKKPKQGTRLLALMDSHHCTEQSRLAKSRLTAVLFTCPSNQ